MTNLAPIAGKLGKLIRLLSSDKNGEVVAAAQALNRALKSVGLDIHALADVVEQPAGRSLSNSEIWNDGYAAGRRAAATGDSFSDVEEDWREMLRTIRENAHRLRNAKEREFIHDMARRRSAPTERQNGLDQRHLPTGAAVSTAFEITLFQKSGGDGLLTKIIEADGDRYKSDGSACRMAKGRASRRPLADIDDAAKLLASFDRSKALALGRLRSDLPNEVWIRTKSALQKLRERRENIDSNVISRSADFIGFRPAAPALCLIDHDSKGAPAPTRERIKELGGFQAALAAVLPVINKTRRLTRASTSAGLFNKETRRPIVGSDGSHIYLEVNDGGDIERFLRALHQRCWLFGLGWYWIGEAGQFLERSIIDVSVCKPERLVFEAAPLVRPPLEQDPEARRPAVYDGGSLDTMKACPDLTAAEAAEFQTLLAAARTALEPEAARTRERYDTAETEKIIRTSSGKITREAARTIVAKRRAGILYPDFVLPFDDKDLAGKTVKDVLENPERFTGATLADPLAGIAYGSDKAKILRRYNTGEPFAHSFAHGGGEYKLRWDYQSIREALSRASGADAVAVLIDRVRRADISETEKQQLIDYAHEQTSPIKADRIGKRAIARELKQALDDEAKRRREIEEQRKLAKRKDKRPRLGVPNADAERLPVMKTLNDVLGKATGNSRPMRDVDGRMTEARMTKPAGMHALDTASVNSEDDSNSRLPPPEQLLLHQLSVEEAGEQIERYIEFMELDEEGKFKWCPVTLPEAFVRHWLKRNDRGLPTVAAVSNLPIVVRDGTVLIADGLHEPSGIYFAVPTELKALLPKKKDCSPDEVKKSLKFLMTQWLCDVLTDDIGKCTIIALALSMVERNVIIEERPAFFISAGKRGGGKTTTIKMLVMAVLGTRAAAASWSFNEEERRKSLMSYLMAGVPLIPWDNIPAGTLIACAHIERACTSAEYTDRKLGVSDSPRAPATTVQVFTGNNVAPKGDLASRTLSIVLDVAMANPEDRAVEHQMPVEWTEAHRGKILSALYTIMLGNPLLNDKKAVLKTRFKEWYQLVGSAVEHAYNLGVVNGGTKLDFSELFRKQDEEAEDNVGLAEVLTIIAGWGGRKAFTAEQLVRAINSSRDDKGTEVRDFLYPGDEHPRTTPKSIGKRLRPYLNCTVKNVEGVTLRLIKHKQRR